MDAPWRITKEKVEQALTRIVEVSKPRKVILFGSYVRGMVDRNSDLDILVVTADDIGRPERRKRQDTARPAGNQYADGYPRCAGKHPRRRVGHVGSDLPGSTSGRKGGL